MDKLTRETLCKLYEEQLLSETEIAQMFGTYQVKISRLRKKWGIATIKNRGSVKLPPLIERQKELLVGSLLGDGYLRVASSSQTAEFNETHGPKQYEYLSWKAEILQPFTSKVIDCMKVSNGKDYPSKRLLTSMCTQLRPYYDLFYNSKGKRVFPAKLKDLMTPFVLAVWYMDDGSLSGKYHPRIAFGLDDLSLKRAIKALRKLGLKATIHEDKRDGSCSIEFPGQSDKFFSMVQNHIPPCMAYKIPTNSKRREQDINAKKLTPQKAQEMYAGGLPINKIAQAFGVGVSTVRRRLKVNPDDVPKRMGRPRKEFSVRALEVSLGNYDSSSWNSLSEQKKNEDVEYILSMLSRVSFPFPVVDEALLIKKFESLQKLVVYLDEDEDAKWIKPQSHTGIASMSPFFPNRFKAQYKDRLSAFNAWYNQTHLERALRWQLRVGDPVTPSRVLKALTANCRTPSIFRPCVAKYLYQTYCPKGGLVYDPCSGFGGRLLGAAAAGVRYLATDVEPENMKGNHLVRDILGLRSADYRVDLHSAEEYDPGKVDMVFTSPPYFNVEKYSQSAQQSYKQFATYKEWLALFLSPIIQTAYRSLPTKGVLALNLKDVKTQSETYPLIEDTIRISLGCGFQHEDTLMMPLARLNKNKRGEPILIFRKP